MTRGLAYFCAVLMVVGIVVLDYAVLTSSAALTHIAERELKAVFGDRLEYSGIKLSLWGGLELKSAGLFVTKSRLKVLSADRLHVSVGRREGSFVPEKLTLERARLTFSDKLLDALAAEPSQGSIDDAVRPEQLPRVVLKGGAIEVAYAGILDVHSPQVFDIDEIQMVPVVDYRYFLGGRVRNATLGDWTVAGEIDLKSGAHDITMTTDELVLGSRVRSLLSPKVHGAWDRYSPVGPVRARIHLVRPAQGELKLVATIQPVDVSMVYAGFPLPFEHVRGEIDFRADGFTIKHIEARSGGARVWLEGSSTGYDADAGYTFRVEFRSLALDDKLKAALQPGAQKVWGDFSPRGTVDAVGMVTRDQGRDKPVRNPLDVTFRDTSFRFGAFPYDVEGLNGDVHIEAPRVVVKYLDGRHLNGRLADGSEDWGTFHFTGILDDIETDAIIDLYMRGKNIALDGALRQALPANLRAVWDDFKPRGAIDFDWHLSKKKGASEEHRGEVRPQGNRIVYSACQVPINNITGELSIEPGHIELQNLRGSLDYGRVTCNGTIKTLAKGNEIHLKFDVEGGVIDDRFKSQMPTAVAGVLKSLKLGGKADYLFKLDMIDDPVKPRTDFVLSVNLTEGVLDAKVRAEEIDGLVQLNGSLVNGQPEAYFSLGFRSARIVGKKATDLTARGYVRGTRVTFEKLRASSYGGTVEGELAFDTESTELAGNFVLDRMELRDFVRDTGKFANRNLSGKVHLEITVAGKADATDLLTGTGSLLITEGQLMEIPAMVNFTSGGGGRFKAARADFVIRGGKFRVDGKNVLAFESDNGAVYGQGSLDFNLYYNFRVTSETAPLFGIDFFIFKILPKIIDLAKAPFKARIRGKLDDNTVEKSEKPEDLKPDEDK